MSSPSTRRLFRADTFESFLVQKPLQSAKLVGITLAVVLGIAGFFRIISAAVIVDHPVLADGQFLALVLLPLASLVLICVVVLETFASAYRALRDERSVRDRLLAKPGYTSIRILEAAVAVVGFSLIASALPVLLADSTPAPAGVGLMLGLMATGLVILVVSLLRALLELRYHAASA